MNILDYVLLTFNIIMTVWFAVFLIGLVYKKRKAISNKGSDHE